MHRNNPDRRSVLLSGLASTLAIPALAAAANAPRRKSAGDDHRGPAAISSANGVATTRLALDMINQGTDPVLAVVEGVGIVEADPNDMTVGLGGLPNEEGVVQLDSSVMHGPTHKAGAVACIEDILHPAQVALKVLQTTDHALIVGPGAKKFALRHGFEETNLVTPAVREAWLRWKANLNPNDDWLDPDQQDWDSDGKEAKVSALPSTGPQDPDAPAGWPTHIPFTYGTIHCGATNADGNVSACTTTSGLSWKIPGRVGDSPIIGAGMYVDNEIGSAGATGRGEAAIQSCTSFDIVQEMGRGMTPTEACLAVLKKVAKRSVKQKRHRDDQGRPNFNLRMYAMRKDGAYGCASMFAPSPFAVATAGGARIEQGGALFER